MTPRKIVPIFCLVFCASVACVETVFAQEDDLVRFLNAGKNDASKLMESYLNPVVEGLSYGLNGGWYHTAKAHKTLGFDLGVSVNAVFIPTSKNYFDPNSLSLETIMDFTSDASNGKAPTITGPEVDSEYSVDVDDDDVSDFTFPGPPGVDLKKSIGMSAVPMATAQIGIGIYKNTDLKFRLVPEQKFGSTKIKLIGFGLMHDVKQHIPGIKLLPFDLSVLVGYTQISGSTGLEGEFNKPADDQREQQLVFDVNALLFQALISKKFSVITFYGGIGFNSIKANGDIKGSYIVEDSGVVVGTFRDPVSMAFKNNSARLTAGMRLKLGVIYLNGDYTLQEYSTVSVGLGFAFR
jgi:hypothetical protein